jgi:hypothetical protein
VCYPATSSTLLPITERLVEIVVLSLPSCMQPAVMIHRMPGGRKGAIPCAMQARCCCDSQNGARKVYYPAVMHARCCHDPQNALGRGVLSAAMQARCCCDSQNAWCKELCYPCAMHAIAVMIHRMLRWKKAASCAAMQVAVMITECSGGRRCAYAQAAASSLLL